MLLTVASFAFICWNCCGLPAAMAKWYGEVLRLPPFAGIAAGFLLLWLDGIEGGVLPLPQFAVTAAGFLLLWLGGVEAGVLPLPQFAWAAVMVGWYRGWGAAFTSICWGCCRLPAVMVGWYGEWGGAAPVVVG